MPLYPVFDIPDEIEGSTVPVYGTSWLFDFEAGDFVQAGGKVVEADGYQTWAQRVVKAATTQRGAFAVYTDEFGCDLDLVADSKTRAEAQAVLQAVITEAITAVDGTGSVSDFAIQATGDSAHVSFTITPTVGASQEVSVTI